MADSAEYEYKAPRRSSAVRKSLRSSFSLGSTVVAQYDKDASTLKVIKTATDDNPLFAGLDELQRQIVLGAFVEENYEKGDTIIEEGERGDIFYVVESGAFEARLQSTGNEVVAHYESGTGFGELALLYNSPRAATVQCVEAGRLWAIDRAVFNVIMIESQTSTQSEAHGFLNATLQDVTREIQPSQLEMITKLMEEVTFSVGDVLWKPKDSVDSLYLVREGEIGVAHQQGDEGFSCAEPLAPGSTGSTGSTSFRARRHTVLKRGDHFGSAMLEDLVYSSNVSTTRLSSRNASAPATVDQSYTFHQTTGKALTRVSVFRLRAASLLSTKEEALGDAPRIILRALESRAHAALKQFLSLSATQRLRLVRGLPMQEHQEGANILATPRVVQVIASGKAQEAGGAEDASKADWESEIGDDTSGTVAGDGGVDGRGEGVDGHGEGPVDGHHAHGEELAVLAPGMCLDEDALRVRRSTARAPIRVCCRTAVGLVNVEADVLVGLSQTMHTVARRTDKLGEIPEDGDALGKDPIVPSKLTHIAVLGSGGYGYVSLAEQTMGDGQKRTFALKRMTKKHVYAKRQVDHINNERHLLGLCDHPFIVELFASFQDPVYIYLALEVVLGGDLFGYLDENGPLDDGGAAFHIGCVCAALEYLHDRSIAYRDLKPENILFDARGYTKLVDFGFAKLVYEGEKTWTLCGTPEYLAPEVILRKGHDVTCDWWSLGVLLIEVLYGSSPFADEENFGVFRRIVKGELEWVTYQLSPVVEHLARGLLTADPAERLGSSGMHGGRAIRECDFMKQVDFLKLVRRDLEAPHVPTIEHEYDTRNCVDEDDLEKPDESFINGGASVDLPEGKRLSDFFPEFESVAEDLHLA